MSETKQVVGPSRYGGLFETVGGVTLRNNNPYPVEVTVRRVAEKVTFERRLIGDGPDGLFLAADFGRPLDSAGFSEGQRVRVTIEPLD